MQILKKVPDSVIWLSNATDTAERNLRSFASKHGVDVNRLVFAKREDRNEDHLARQRLADLFLDAFPHNAHATSCDALWAGLPIVTKIGNGFAARVAASLLTSVGLPELIANSDEEYIRTAVKVAMTQGESLRLKQKLAANIAVMPLFNIEKYARNIERAYERMVEQGVAPAPITLSDISE
jgi:predicted O-linked N-acetylglucosamine transferase (SPINDLY family)